MAAPAASNSLTTLSGWFKTAYADEILNLIPDNVHYAREINSVSKSAKTGGDYAHPVTLTSEQGITKAAAGSGTFALNPPIAMATRQATLAPSNFILRSGFDYETLTRLEGKNAFVTETTEPVKNMIDSAFAYQEMDIMWGKSGVATILAVGGAPTYTITVADFAPGMWWGSEGRMVTIYSAAGVLRGSDWISSYVMTPGAPSFTTTAAIPGVVATDVVYFTNGGAASEMNGLHQYMTAAGIFLGINPATYQLWAAGAAYGVAGACSFNHIQTAITTANQRGLGVKDKGVEVVLNPRTWTTLANDESALRAYDASFKPSLYDNGAEDIKFYSVAGPVRIISHPFMKQGYAFVHPPAKKCMSKVGSRVEPTFDIPGQIKGQEYLATMPNNAGVETRLYWNAALFSGKRSQFQLMTGIVNP